MEFVKVFNVENAQVLIYLWTGLVQVPDGSHKELPAIHIKAIVDGNQHHMYMCNEKNSKHALVRTFDLFVEGDAGVILEAMLDEDFSSIQALISAREAGGMVAGTTDRVQ